MPRPLSHSRRHRAQALQPRPPHWRPRVSSPLTSEIVFSDKEEKSDATYISIDSPGRLALTHEEDNFNRPRVSHIIFSLFVDCLLSFCLCRIALDNLLNLRDIVASIPPAYQADGKVMFCLPIHNADPRFVALADYPILPPGKLLSDFVDLPPNCSFLPNPLVAIGQSTSMKTFIPLLIICFITLKLAFGLLVLRTSPNPRAPLNYLKKTAAIHLLITYLSVVYVKVNFKSLLDRYPTLERLLTRSSEFMYFILGFLFCLFLLSLVVVPLLWVFSSNNEERGHSEIYLPTQSTQMSLNSGPKSFDARNSVSRVNEKCSSAIQNQKKKSFSSRL